MTEAPLSPVTEKPMVRDTRALELKYKSESVTVQMPGWYCSASDESVHTDDDMKVSDAALRNLKIKVENLLPPEEIKRIRNKLGLTQREAGDLIGGGPNAFQKYESGDGLLSKGMSNFLRMLDKHPEQLKELEAT
ncbi:type II toxin-antitoxin system MqsA family antitoxin [Bradyrhizobium genosp. P]|uniref:type II toxin-antitoxin system MqsA family antitoxin n=1 Tax=Bradyrhizobium genosp. P TaxID=83641 RepID=UPI003CED8BA9